MSNSHRSTMGSFTGTNSYFYSKSRHENQAHNPYQLGSAVMHTEHAMKSKVHKIKLSQYQAVQGKISFVAIGISAHAAAAHSNITHNKLMIFACIA